MDYKTEHKKWCTALLKRAEAHVKKTNMGKTYLCRKAGVQIHALDALANGVATPKTLQRLSDYLDALEKSSAGASK